MLLLSRHRNETKSDTQIAETLAKELETLVLSVPFLYDLPRTGQTAAYLQTLNEPILTIVSPLPPRPAAVLVKQIFQWQEKTLLAYSSETDDISSLCNSLKKLQRDSPSFGDVPGGKVERLEESITERWYPLIDVERCTACLECVNFCLFGVYAIGENNKPFVDQPDVCRSGCPACSRVCPGKAIIFPLYDDPVISGAVDAPEEGQNLDDLVDTLDQLGDD